ncbi:phosphatidylserine decarboxylase-domain-containing protein [Fomitopsis serialis]|uniref:phosphatidylserine decarboxylase-domain-containing protein n=1 Tax=Fomitopsis serialis TaxID=139415 RepID=UPI002008DDCC|nr:phosphatidylserine decarboxylase-domain-containing protein [Neoantrodia serialis]KAH9920334.1 phosphatidylserine decarboxylase-domain-containing protein [Neoantrodia serialis]
MLAGQRTFLRLHTLPLHRPLNSTRTSLVRPRHVITSSATRRCQHRLYSSEPPKSSGRLSDAWTQTPTKWYPLPVAVGALLLIVLQYRRTRRSEKEVQLDEQGQVVKLKGPWQVYVLGALPLNGLSRVWGYLNSLQLPVWFRPFGFKLYSRIFGCNLDEIDPLDLTQYASLGDFFYRKLKPGVRPVADSALVSPADGRVLHFGVIRDGRVEQIKGATYSLDALLGVDRPDSHPPAAVEFQARDQAEVLDRTFADINGIQYSLHDFLGTPHPPPTHGEQTDASVSSDASLQDVVAHEAGVAAEMGVRPFLDRAQGRPAGSVKPGHALFFAVIYLAPGDYHRFHSPTAWVVEKRRHFLGDLFSVSPWMVEKLADVFVLNERVALLGRWKHGFFGMVPVGATNVGSIKINFDQVSATERPPHECQDEPPTTSGTFEEAVYTSASPVLRGQPLAKAQEMGGFCWGFAVRAGQKIKVGEKMGDLHSSLVEKQ